jgi:hypothetical protein
MVHQKLLFDISLSISQSRSRRPSRRLLRIERRDTSSEPVCFYRRFTAGDGSKPAEFLGFYRAMTIDRGA